MSNIQTKLFLTAAFMLTQFTTGLYIAVMPAVSHYYHVSHHAMMLTMSLFLTGFAVGQLFWGTLSDYYSRKQLLLMAFAIYAMLSFVLCLPLNYWLYLVIFLVWGFTTAAMTSIGNALVKAIYGGQASKVIAGIGIAMATGPIIGPFIGAQLFSLFNMANIIFIVLALYAAINGMGIYWALQINYDDAQATKTDNHTAGFVKALKSLVHNPHYIYYVLSLFLLYGAFMGYVSISAFLFKTLGLSDASYGNYYLLSGISCVIGTLANRYCMTYLGPRFLVLLGTILTLIGSILLIVDHASLTSAMIAITVFMFGFGFIVPSCKAGAMVSQPVYLGTASSIMKFLQIVGGVIFTGLLSWLDNDFINMALLILLAAVVSLVLCVLLSLYERCYGK